MYFFLIGSRSDSSYFQGWVCIISCLKSLYFLFLVFKLFMVRVEMFMLTSMLHSPHMARFFWLLHVIVRALSGRSYFILI